MEIKLVGKPAKIIRKETVTIVTMAAGPPPSLPKGLPQPPAAPTVYLVYIAAKQWRQVAETVNDPDNKLIIKGWPIYDKQLGTITVLAQSTTSTLLEREKRAQQTKETPT